MMRVCHLNTCPVGVATQDPELRKQFTGKPEFVVNFFELHRRGGARATWPQLGFRTLDEMVGHVELLDVAPGASTTGRRSGLDFSPILHGRRSTRTARRCYCIDGAGPRPRAARSTTQLIAAARAGARARASRSSSTLPIRNVNRTVGTMLGAEVTRRYGARRACPTTRSTCTSRGSAGQSFGAFVPRGITLRARRRRQRLRRQGPVGRQARRLSRRASATFVAEENIIIGNVALYGATSGEAYIRGVAGERFCVRNCGAHRGRRGRRRPRLRVHDRRPRRRARPDRAATSPPACPAASPTCCDADRHVRAPLQPRDGRARAARRRRPRVAARAPSSATAELTGTDGRRAPARRRGRARSRRSSRSCRKDYQRVLDGDARGRAARPVGATRPTSR